MGDNDGPGARPVWIPGARLAELMKRSTIHTTYESSVPCGFREDNLC